MIDRFFLDAELRGQLSLEGKEQHHLAHVMRLNTGDTVELINGRGDLAQGVIKELSKKSASIEILSVKNEKKPKPLILAQAVVRRPKLEWALEKGTELGITEFWLYPAEKGEKGALSASDLERLHGLIVAAMKQSGRLFLPEILLKKPLKEWSEPLENFIFGDIRPGAPPLFSLQTEVKGAVIGPESGFSKEEVQKMEALRAEGASFTSSILRTESAAVAASTLLAHLRHTRSFSKD